MEELKIYSFLGIFALIMLVCFFLLERKDKEVRIEKAGYIKLELKLRLDWEVCSMLLTNKPIRELIYRMQNFDGTEEEAREIVKTREFEIIAVIVDRLLTSSLNLKESKYAACHELVGLFYKNVIFLQAVYERAEKFPKLIEVLEKLRKLTIETYSSQS